MQYGPIVLMALMLGVGCGYFEYWMTVRLVKKRWLLLLQPVLLAAAALCFTAWTLSIDRLKGTPARWAGVPFGVILGFTLVGWAMGEARRRRH